MWGGCVGACARINMLVPLGHPAFASAPWPTATLASKLQVSTSDGRIKIIGHEGVEKTIKAADHTGTRHIQFLVNKGAVLRVTQVGLTWQSAWHCCTRRRGPGARPLPTRRCAWPLTRVACLSRAAASCLR